MVTAPATSKARAWSEARLSAISRGVRAKATRLTGTFTHSTHSQPRPSVRMPPSRTPAAPPAPATAPQTPSALLRSAPSRKIVVTIESAAGGVIGAPHPPAARGGEVIAAPPPRRAGGGDQWVFAGGKPRRQRGDGDQHQSRHEDAPAPQQV